MSELPARLELRGITKAFPGVLANDSVNLNIKRGEIHALLGENGAGKSTLVKMIYGIMQPDQGQILWEGKPVTVQSPKMARAMGVGMVFQHFSLFEALTVLENIALGFDEAISNAELEKKIKAILDQYGLMLDPRRYVHDLSVGERQRIEIVRALLLEPSLLIMDEPTSVLTPQEVSQLFKTLRQLCAGGCSILYISHKLNEIKELCDTATILRGGRVVGFCNPREESAKSMAELMIGGDLRQTSKAKSSIRDEVAFAVKSLSLPKPSDFGVALKNINFEVRKGEIFGVAGVAGNGQNELYAALSGEMLCVRPDTVTIHGKAVGEVGIETRRTHVLCAVPEERNGHAAVVNFSLTDNAILSARKRMGFVTSGLINAKKSASYADDVIKQFKVKTTGSQSHAGSLSGGNLQKYIVGREIMQNPSVLLIAQPTWGVDAGAAASIHQALMDLAEQGSAIIVISQDLDELLTICDRLVVINEGEVSEPLDAAKADIEEIGLLMGGASKTGQAA